VQEEVGGQPQKRRRRLTVRAAVRPATLPATTPVRTALPSAGPAGRDCCTYTTEGCSCTYTGAGCCTITGVACGAFCTGQPAPEQLEVSRYVWGPASRQLHAALSWPLLFLVGAPRPSCCNTSRSVARTLPGNYWLMLRCSSHDLRAASHCTASYFHALLQGVLVFG